MFYAISVTLPRSDLTLYRTSRGTWVHGLLVDAAEKFRSMEEVYRKIKDLGRRDDGLGYEIAGV